MACLLKHSKTQKSWFNRCAMWLALRPSLNPYPVRLMPPPCAESAWLDPGSSLARHLMDSYEAMGHTLALQYGEGQQGA